MPEHNALRSKLLLHCCVLPPRCRHHELTVFRQADIVGLTHEYREIGEDRATDLPADETGGRRGDAQ